MLLDIAGHLGVQFDVLVRDELAGNRKRSGDRFPLDWSDCGVGNTFGIYAWGASAIRRAGTRSLDDYARDK